ncbi:TPA: hypothetical protein ACGPA6_001289 [Streptococcus suis]
MNIAAKELIESSIEWTNAALSRLAKEHGGPEQLIADIYENGYLDGYSDALRGEKMKQYGIIGLGVTSLAALAAVTCYYYRKSKSRQKELEQQVAENAKLKAKEYSAELFETDSHNSILSEKDNIIDVNFRKEA